MRGYEWKTTVNSVCVWVYLHLQPADKQTQTHTQRPIDVEKEGKSCAFAYSSLITDAGGARELGAKAVIHPDCECVWN